MNNIVAGCALALTLSACNTIDNRAGIDRVNASMLTSRSTGVVIFSTGADHDCIATSTFLKLFDQTTLRGVAGVSPAPVDGYSSKSDFSDHRGNVSAYPLLPGKYYLSPVIANPYVVGVKVPAFAFEVHGGETVYLGEIYMPVGCSFSNVFEVNDKYARDIAIAARQNPALALRTPVKRLLANHATGDGSKLDAPAPLPGVPINELFKPTAPRRPENGGVATLKDVVPQAPSAISMPAPLATRDGLNSEKWAGTMKCGARLDRLGKKSYEERFTMEKRGGDVTLLRTSATAAEVLSGRVEDGALTLTGNGTMANASRSWTLRFSGPFAAGAAEWSATGAMNGGAGIVRQCVLNMRRG